MTGKPTVFMVGDRDLLAHVQSVQVSVSRNPFMGIYKDLLAQAQRVQMSIPGAPRCEDCGDDLEHSYDMKCRRCLYSAARAIDPGAFS